MAQPSLLVTAASRSRQDGKSQWSRRVITLHDQGHGGEAAEAGGAWVKGEGYRGRAEGQGEVVGEDDEGEVGEEATGHVGNAEVGAAVETDGPRSWLEEMAEMISLWEHFASFMETRVTLMDSSKLSRRMRSSLIV